MNTPQDPHNTNAILRDGPPPREAAGVIVLVHGRGAGAGDIMNLGRILVERAGRDDLCLLAPEATTLSWYPNRFLAPTESNQPWLDSARGVLDRLVDGICGSGDVPLKRIILAGFSQGACLVSDVLYRRPRLYGGALLFSGGLIGAEGTAFPLRGSLEGTPVLLGCSDRDPHIPRERVDETAAVLTAMNARVDCRIYENMGHTINEDEIDAATAMVHAALQD